MTPKRMGEAMPIALPTVVILWKNSGWVTIYEIMSVSDESPPVYWTMAAAW